MTAPTRRAEGSARLCRRHRPAAAAGQEFAGLSGQPRADALHAGGDGDAGREDRQAAIDAAAEKFGMPMGPIELADQVGLDICLDVGHMLRSKFGDFLPPTPASLRDKVAKGEFGRKPAGILCLEGRQGRQGAGFAVHAAQPTPEMIDRLILPMSNSASLPCEKASSTIPIGSTRHDLRDRYALFRGGPLIMCGPGGRTTSSRPCARSPRNSAAGLCRMRLGEFQTAISISTSAGRHFKDRHRGGSRPGQLPEIEPLRRSLHPHAGDACRYQPERRYFRRVAARPDGYRRRHVCFQDCKIPHRHGGDRGDEFSQARLCRRPGLGACQRGPDRPDLGHRPSRGLGDAPQGNSVRSWSPTAISPMSRSTIRGARRPSSEASRRFQPDDAGAGVSRAAPGRFKFP